MAEDAATVAAAIIDLRRKADGYGTTRLTEPDSEPDRWSGIELNGKDVGSPERP